MLKIRRLLGRLIFNMGIAIPGKTVFLIETAPRCLDALCPLVVCVPLTMNNIKQKHLVTLLFIQYCRFVIFINGISNFVCSVMINCFLLFVLIEFHTKQLLIAVFANGPHVCQGLLSTAGTHSQMQLIGCALSGDDMKMFQSSWIDTCILMCNQFCSKWYWNCTSANGVMPSNKTDYKRSEHGAIHRHYLGLGYMQHVTSQLPNHVSLTVW